MGGGLQKGPSSPSGERRHDELEKMISSTPEVVGLTSKEDRWDSSVASLATISPRSRAALVYVAIKSMEVSSLRGKPRSARAFAMASSRRLMEASSTPRLRREAAQ